MTFTKSEIMKWSAAMMFISLIAAASLAAGKAAAPDVMKGCLAALAVCGFAGCIALLPIFYSMGRKTDWILLLALAAGVIRLLLTIVGCVILCALVTVNVLWFIGWTAIFYLMVLILEIRIAIRAISYN
jgi:hypothetical protein